jgi:uncharacterized protein
VSEPSRLARVRRHPDRARYDAEAVHAVPDAAPFCHVATVRHRRPVVLPMAHARLGDTLVLHGSAAAGLFRDMRRASPVCVTATLLDGLVLARSARSHSMNYRSVTIHGEATQVIEPDEKIIGMQALVEHLAPGRWVQLRQLALDELPDTGLWQVRSRRPRSRPAAGRRSTRRLTSPGRSGPARCPRAWSSGRRSRPRTCPPASIRPAAAWC